MNHFISKLKVMYASMLSGGRLKMRIIYLMTILILTSLSNISFAQDCSQVIESNDAMQFNMKEMRVSSDCQSLTITLKHVGNLPQQFMGHNWVLSTTEDMMPLTGVSMQAGAPNYLPENDSRVIAATEMIGGGQESSVTFDVSALNSSTEYTYFCTFPGHYAIMKGVFIIE
jgi:azurin|tara:strand:+ start:1513 stop:2025 length:513 start_codon:yes stop_codon:yes gene_type:complete